MLGDILSSYLPEQFKHIILRCFSSKQAFQDIFISAHLAVVCTVGVAPQWPRILRAEMGLERLHKQIRQV